MRECKRQVFLVLLLLTGLAWQVNGQTIVIKSKDGTLNDKALNSLKKFSFSGNNLQLDYRDGTNERFLLTAIDKLYFESLPVGVERVLSSGSDSKLTLFPNPVVSTLNLKNIGQSRSTVYLYRMDGTLIKSYPSEEGNCSLDLGYLSRGFYFIRVNNQSLKFMKL